jgi:hypothetical protein
MSETRNELEDEGIPDLQDTVTSDDNEGLIPPRDYPQAVNEFGTTAAEESRGESLAQRVAREEPDFGEQGAPSGDLDDETGRVVEPITEGGIDDEAASIGDLVTDDASGLSAEEAAMHVVDEDDAL